MTQEICWCCGYGMTREIIPYTEMIIHWCSNCDPSFDKIKFASEFTFDGIDQ